ncbi:ATP-binding protein, partial [Pseudomonas sp.]|uniref:sensor histidine kinase n=1 Tax=Pseudomonas sp. TaxID=306 RepID=UPI0025878F6D
MPDHARHWFAHQHWKPFAFQKQVWAAVKAGQSGLLHASTGAGKTYALWFAALQQFARAGSRTAPLTVNGDAKRLVQVVANLLNNAAKYTPPGGQVALTVTLDGVAATAAVRDNGSGIDAGLLPHVFDLFTQADRTPDR